MSVNLQIGTIVQVKSEPEILATLDDNGMLDGLPFTREMRKFCGDTRKVLRILNRIHIDGASVRGIDDVVILDGARCDGTDHQGCGRACFLLFKRAWLNVPEKSNLTSSDSQTSQCQGYEPLFWKNGAQPCQGNGPVLVKATKSLSVLNMRQYIHDLKTGVWRPRDIVCMLLFRLNRKWDTRQRVWELSQGDRSFGDLARMAFIVICQTVSWHLGRIRRAVIEDSKAGEALKTGNPPSQPLNLQPGEFIEVKSREEIRATLDESEKHKGLGFVGSMLKDCGKRFRVLSRVNSLVDERTGRQFKSIKNSVLLESSVCNGLSYRGCPRMCYWLWREDWLKRVE